MYVKEKHCPTVDKHEDTTLKEIAGSGSGPGPYMQIALAQKSSAVGRAAPPPIAMSLRAREDGALSLKRIFEQHMLCNAAASRTEQEGRSSPRGQRSEGFQGPRDHCSSDLRKRDSPLLDLSFGKAQASSGFANTRAGFGSPISSPAPTNQDPISSFSIQQNSHTPHGSSAPYAREFSSKPTAQLTIFYSGAVNVYEDVPVDKARAIMVLARNALSSNTRNLATSTVAAMVAGAVPSRAEIKGEKETAFSPTKGAPSRPEALPTVDMVHANRAGGVKNTLSHTSAACARAVLPMASSSPSRAPVSLAESESAAQRVGLPARLSSGIELPLARKVSLARFLEKRKDRVVQVQPLGADQECHVAEKGEREGEEMATRSGKGHEDSTALSSSKLPQPQFPKRQSADSLSSREHGVTSSRTKVKEEGDDVSNPRKRRLGEEDDDRFNLRRRRSSAEHCFFQ